VASDAADRTQVTAAHPHPRALLRDTTAEETDGGPALFLAGRALFEYEVFGRVSRSRLIGFGVLAAISPAMIIVPPLVVASAAALVLTGIAVSDAARARGRPPEPPSPPG